MCLAQQPQPTDIATTPPPSPQKSQVANRVRDLRASSRNKKQPTLLTNPGDTIQAPELGRKSLLGS